MPTRKIRNSKSEIRNKSKWNESKCQKRWRHVDGNRFGFGISVIRACFGFRNSNFGFPTLGLMFLALCASGRADVMDSARMLPDDTMVMISVESVSGLRAAMEKTSLYGLYKDPAMQEFVTETEKKVRELIGTKLKEFWKEMEIENPPEQLPYPEGRLVLGFSVFSVADGNAEGPGRPGFHGVLLADMGSRVEQAKQMIRALTASVENSGDTVTKKDVAGLEFNVTVPNADPNDPLLYYGLKDNWLVVAVDNAKDTAFVESVVRRMSRSLPGSLSEKAGFQSAARTLGDAQAFFFVNVDAVKSLVLSGPSQRARAEMVIKALGLENVTGLSMCVQIAGRKNQETVSKMLIGVDGSKTGLVGVLGDASGPLKLNSRLLPKDTVGLMVANYEPAKAFDGISKIVQGIAGMDLNMLAQMGMQATAGTGGEPPVQLRDDVLAQTSGPLLVAWQAEPTPKISGVTRFLLALSAKDAGRLDSAMGRIHRALLGGRPETTRELLNRNLYLLPNGSGEDEDEDEEQDGGAPIVAASAQKEMMAFSVTGDSLVLGSVDEVEQTIRRQEMQPQDSLLTDPMFRYAKDSLPSQACMFFYQNNRLNMESMWAALKQMGKDLAQQSEGASSWNPLMAELQQIRDYMDLNKLPEFKAVEKYWGASVGYMQSGPEGLYWETATLRPQQQ